MAFHSFTFILIVLPVVVVFYRTLCPFSIRAANLFLLIASATFYLWSSPRNGIWLAISVLLNLGVGRWIAASSGSRAKWLLAIGIVCNVLFLCFFKYAGSLINAFQPWFGLQSSWKTPFPLGISFFTVQQVMYLVDIQERLSAPATLFDHLLAVSYFPYVSAGPITRIRDIVKQFHSPRQDGASDVATGLMRFAMGLFKKVVLADTLAIVVNAGFGNAASLSMAEGWLTCFLYTLQIYLDFSGYCDMAIGCARMLGHTVPENFNNPLLAGSITDFWQRWHMTLTNFITNYLFTPILRSWGKVTRQKAMLATVFAMAIVGVWHGSGLTFLIFGLVHGIGLAGHLAWKGAKRKLPLPIGRVLTFALVAFAFLFFRSPDMKSAAAMFSAVAGGHGLNASAFALGFLIPALQSYWRITAVVCVLAPLLVFLGPTTTDLAKLQRFTRPLAFGVSAALLATLVFLNSTPDRGFIYAGF